MCIILQAANNTERIAILSKLEPPVLDDGTTFKKILTFSKTVPGKAANGKYFLGIFARHKAALVQTQPGDKCRSLIDVTIEVFPNVSWIIGMGIAYGGKRDKTSFGDVLVSDKIEELDIAKFRNDSSIVGNGNKQPVLGDLHTTFCMGENMFDDTFKCTKGGRYSKAHVGTIISGSFLVDHKLIKDELWKNAREAIGGEMEGYVLMDIIRQRDLCPIKAIIIKGVSDYGDGTKTDEWQMTAALAAVEYAYMRLKDTLPRKFLSDHNACTHWERADWSIIPVVVQIYMLYMV